jgi:hypothetical protein
MHSSMHTSPAVPHIPMADGPKVKRASETEGAPAAVSVPPNDMGQDIEQDIESDRTCDVTVSSKARAAQEPSTSPAAP